MITVCTFFIFNIEFINVNLQKKNNLSITVKLTLSLSELVNTCCKRYFVKRALNHNV